MEFLLIRIDILVKKIKLLDRFKGVFNIFFYFIFEEIEI